MSVENKLEDIMMIDIDNVRPNEWNPNEMSDMKFNTLCEEIDKEGFDQPILVIKDDNDDYDEEWKVVDGENRLMAGEVLGMEKIPAIHHEDWDELDAKTKTVRRNQVTGSLNREKFTELVDDVQHEYSGEKDALARAMGMDDINEMESNYVGELVDEEPDDEMEDFVDEAMEDDVEEEMDTVDNLSSLLNHICDEYGDTMSDSYIWFMFKSTRQLMVNMDKELLTLVEKAVDQMKDEDENMRDQLKEFFEEKVE